MERTAEQLASLKQITLVVYVLQALGYLTGGLTAIVAIVINYIKKDEVAGTLFESHFRWQIRTFWWGLVWGIVGFVLMFVVIGFAVWFAAWIWMIYRVVKGWLKLTENQEVVAA